MQSPPVPEYDLSVDVMMQLVRNLHRAIDKSKASTLASLRKDIDPVLDQEQTLKSGADMLRLRLIEQVSTRMSGEEMRKAMLKSCEDFLSTAPVFPDIIANYVLPFVRDTSVVVVHGSGMTLVNCVACCIVSRPGVRFFVAEGLPQASGGKLLQEVRRHPRIIQLEEELRDEFKLRFRRSLTLVTDSSLASLLPETDLVLVGAHVVTEHGGLVHSTGTLQLAIVANAMRTPFYVVCETFKFSSIFPLSTEDLYNVRKNRMRSALSSGSLPDTEHIDSNSTLLATNRLSKTTDLMENESSESTVAERAQTRWTVELVPPRYISLIFSEEGIMPPSAVAEQTLQMRRTLSVAPKE